MTLSSPLKTVIQGDLVLKNKRGKTITVRANGTDLFLTAIVTTYGETLPDADLAGAGEPVGGVIIAQAFPYKVDLDKDSDDTFSDNTYLKMYVPQGGEWIYLTVATNTTIAQGGWFKASGGFITSSAKADALGRVIRGITAVSSQEQVALCEWGVDA